jgi:large subunit ribosomal protein L35
LDYFNFICDNLLLAKSLKIKRLIDFHTCQKTSAMAMSGHLKFKEGYFMANKIKTHSGAKKRLKKTASGKIKIKKQGTQHLLGSKRPKRKRRLNASNYVFEGNMKRANRMLPNG